MLRRQPSRQRTWRASFGRRVPVINFAAIEQDILAIRALGDDKILQFPRKKKDSVVSIGAPKVIR